VVDAVPRWDVLGLGIAAVDDLLYVDAYPRPDSKVAVRARQRQGGGLTATALVAAARLGARAAYGGVLGDDELSRFTLQELEREGVDCAPVLCKDEAGPCHSVVVVDRSTGSRTILYSSERVLSRQPDEVTPDLIGQCRLLFVDYATGYGGLRAVRLAHDLGIEVVGDVERLTVPGAEELLHEIDHLIVGIEFAALVTEETQPEDMVRALFGSGRTCCAVTAGDRGCWYAKQDGEVHHVPAYRVPVVDTTGCGDVFHGAYAAIVSSGGSVDRAIEVATAVAALKATRPGGRAGIPDRDTVERFVQESGRAVQRAGPLRSLD
jgi:sugar/nucleoside kinase (ribokinase family)